MATCLASVLMLSGCGASNRGFLSLAGPVATLIHDEFVFFPMLLVPLSAWHCRISNTESACRLQRGVSRSLEGLTWIPPAAVVITPAVFLWRDTRRLNPFRSLPGEAIAAGQPVHLDLTSATVMQAFLVPDLQLLLFSTMILALIVGGTPIVVFNLRQRMM